MNRDSERIARSLPHKASIVFRLPAVAPKPGCGQRQSIKAGA